MQDATKGLPRSLFSAPGWTDERDPQRREPRYFRRDGQRERRVELALFTSLYYCAVTEVGAENSEVPSSPVTVAVI